MVKFVKQFQNYNKGESASFTPEHEKWLIDNKFGHNEPVKGKPEQEPAGQNQNRQTVVPQK